MISKIDPITLLSRLLRPLFPQRPPPSRPRTLLVIKPCCLGDVVLATATIAALKRRYPQAELDVAVGEWSRAALENNPHIRQLVDSGRVGQGRYNLLEVWSLARKLRRRRYDLAVTLDRSPVIGLLPWLAGVRHRVGLDSFGRGFAHTRPVPVPATPRHEALIYLACVAATGLNLPEGLEAAFWTEFYPAPEDKEALALVQGRPFVLLHPAGGANPGMQHLDKRWPVRRFAALAGRLSRRGFHIVLTGGAADAPLCRLVAAQMGGVDPQILAGRLTLGQFGAFCREAALFVGGDTGAMHLAVACGCKTVAIFGPSDPRRYGPFAPEAQARVVWREIPLPQGGVGQGQVSGFCWEQGATVDEVWEACRMLLGL